jgi:dihydrofolate reductase
MRKIVAGLFVSLDGVVEAPEEWTGPYFNDEVGQEVGSLMAEADTMLLGRVTYQTFAAAFADQTGGMADLMNSVPKVIVSKSLDKAEWQNSVLVDGAVTAELTKLKQRGGKSIAVSGSPTLVRSLLRDGLLDELRLLLFPTVVGGGKRLFDGGSDHVALKLADSKAFDTGVLRLTYQPA